MMPTKVFQLDYQELEFLVNEHVSKIKEFEESKNLKFDLIISDYENSNFVGSIISNKLNIKHVSYSLEKNKLKFFPLNPQNFKSILFVNTLCVNDKFNLALEKIKEKLKNDNIYSYATLVAVKNEQQVDIKGLLSEEYFMTPWLWNTFTPESHLDRIYNNDIETYSSNTIQLGFSSEKSLFFYENFIGSIFKNEWVSIFNLEKIKSSSVIDTLDKLNEKTFVEYNEKINVYIKEKSKFIKENGITHFFEENINQILLLSNLCPTVFFYYIDNDYIYKVKSKKMHKSSIVKYK